MTDLIDANVLIEAHRRYYGMDICPGFWDWMAKALASGDVALLPQVEKEITPRSQRLIGWLRDEATVAEPITLRPVGISRRRVTTVANASGCTQFSINRFLKGGDYHLAAFAHAGSHRVVTLETKEDPNKANRRLKIPDLCNSMGIDWATPFRMLSDHDVEFELAK